jgi:uncharacterized membrane protein
VQVCVSIVVGEVSDSFLDLPVYLLMFTKQGVYDFLLALKKTQSIFTFFLVVLLVSGAYYMHMCVSIGIDV